MAIKNNKKNFSTQVKVGKFKTPAEIVRDLINKEKVFPLEKGGALKYVQALSPALNLVAPGLGAAVGGAAGLAYAGMNKEEEQNLYTMNKQLKDGGEVSGFKQYNAPSHEMGGQTINKEGIPTQTNPVAEIEGTENSYKYGALPDKAGSSYVFSDANKTSGMVKDIISKYKKKNTDNDLASKAAMEMEIKDVENINEAVNTAKQAVSNMMQMRYGGEPKYTPGGSLGYQPLDFSLPQNTSMANIPNRNVQLANVPLGANARLEAQQEQSLPNTRKVDPLPTIGNSYDVVANKGTVESTTTPDPFKSISEESPLEADSNNLNIDLPSIMRTAGLVAGGIDALSKPDVEKEIQPDFNTSDEKFNAMNATLDQARQDVTGASNRASELNRGASSSYSQFRARELSNIGNLQDSLGQIGMQEQQLRNQILGQQGQYEMQKSTIERNIKQENQVNNMQNKARTQDIRRQFMSDVVAEADRLSTAKNMENINNAKIEEGKALIKMIAPDFDVNSNMVTNLIKVSKGQIKPEDLSDEELIVFTRLKETN